MAGGMTHINNKNNHPAHTRIAVIGAGIAGLSCASRLRGLPDVSVTVFESDAAIGGRVKTRVEATGSFDAGAQFISANHDYFESEIARWRQAGIVEQWRSRFWRHEEDDTRLQVHDLISHRWIGYGGMSAVADYLAKDVDIRTGYRLVNLARVSDMSGWVMSFDTGDGRLSTVEADLVLLAMPAPQAEPFLTAAPAMRQLAEQAEYAPCWSVMVAWDKPVDVVFEAISAESRSQVRTSLPVMAGSDRPVAWLCRETAKPGRHASDERWVIHATVDYALQHMDTAPDKVAAELFAAAKAMSNPDLPDPDWMKAIRFDTARVMRSVKQDYLYDKAMGLGAMGDWCHGPGIEGAWLSGFAMAGAVLRSFVPQQVAP